uniref:Glycosyltransferase n=1 Tax=Scutellaria baicalensis TaxID=65409 RepID=Q9SXF2_SCUBA|nr:Sbaic7OGT [synthetic construct]BAA83484.1 UDP-glucose: flavonoid 7-O-glucosyltransferase [Scutellaria baicalensis]
MGQLHIVLVPMIAHGHMIPMLDMAKLFSSRGVKTTIIATPAFAEPIRKARESGHDIGLTTTKFPPKGSSLPDNIRSLDQVTDDLLPHFFRALELLQEPVEEIMEDLKPDCLVSDMFLPWTTDSAAKFGIPRLLFHGTSLFARCFAEQMSIQKPYKNVSSDSEPFVLRGLPHEVSFVRTQIPDYELQEGGDDAFSKMAKQMRDADKKSYGDVINSFEELESEYADYNKNVFGKKAWHIGPLKLFNNRAEQKSSQRGKESAIDDHECLAWLNSKKPNSVVYMCFGSMATFTPAQLHETAVGLESSGQDFIWVVRNGGENEDWLPQGFEERIKGKGLMIRGWAPQVMILDHPSTGAFVTHCGWNSTLEGICAGLPMVTWPVFAEQFYNEKLVTEVLKTGVSVGNKKWQRVGEGVGSEAVKEAVERVMVGDGAAEMRSRALYYKEMARKAVEEGGSSYNNLNALIEELSAYVPPMKQGLN